jgi:hypothetical protein
MCGLDVTPMQGAETMPEPTPRQSWTDYIEAQDLALRYHAKWSGPRTTIAVEFLHADLCRWACHAAPRMTGQQAQAVSNFEQKIEPGTKLRLKVKR